ncbi:hypothetical protein A3A38_01035 [Candidatus Kaiserbacteria bacterium RIFCSPLOWO2_01_FULL_53_17]|uniref:Uncharacterized protein n=1 Tax=Candidatus Kaiserbacteria bacterium RIFCSPLOWO2_01_FULL_53_17 TaxID=1798511 RepID=A0A1F6EHB3_9BACT|nr:MAG: hypothetical protein A3A38_01035 [Candidatus Kaiserbacteria bacterium RIFCSPLOWO2_01_FULL_53_17]
MLRDPAISSAAPAVRLRKSLSPCLELHPTARILKPGHVIMEHNPEEDSHRRSTFSVISVLAIVGTGILAPWATFAAVIAQ